MGAGEVGADTT